jgi:hypothetical protein
MVVPSLSSLSKKQKLMPGRCPSRRSGRPVQDVDVLDLEADSRNAVTADGSVWLL